MRKTFDDYRKCLRELRDKNECLVIYGAGKIGQSINKFMLESNIKVDAFCVTRMEGNRDTINDIPVMCIDDVVGRDGRNAYIIACRKPVKPEIEQKLLMLGISEKDIIDMTDLGAMVDGAYFRPVLEITPKIGCKINCRFCPQKLFINRYYENNPKRKSEMNFDDFQICIDKTPSDLIVQFMGFVEPFLSNDAIDMMLYANEIGRDVTLSTTLVGLTLDKFKKIEKIPFKFLMLHLPDKKGYANIPMSDEYFKLLDYVLDWRNSQGAQCTTVANSQCETHPDVVKALKNRISVSWNMFDRAGNLSDSELPKTKKKEGRLECVLAKDLNHNVLLPDGTVVLCCMDWGMRYILGNLLKDSYDDLMNSRVLRELKKDLMVGNGGKTLCANCADSFVVN